MHPMKNLSGARAASIAVAALCLAHAPGAAAQSFLPAVPGANIVKLGVTEYTTNSKTSGITGVGVPAGADAEVGNATTAILTYERLLTPDIGVEFVIGYPPRLKAKATGSVAFLGDDVLSAKILAPTLLVNYHFTTPVAALRPYLGAGINYTKFSSVKSSLAPDVQMGSSTGLALQAGVDYAITKDIGLFASVAKLHVSSDVVASGATVLTTNVNFRPIVYSAGVSWRF